MANRNDIEQGKVDEIDSSHVEDGARTVEEWKSILLQGDPPMLPTCCIFRVPEVLRRQNNKEAYEPRIVSIGPFHRGGKQFQHAVKVKKWYLSCFLSNLKISLESLIKRVIEELEQTARGYYADTFHHLDQNKFVEMLILDGCFLIELFLRGLEDDPICNVSYMHEYLYHDLLLLENQLPWPVLEFFYDLLECSNNYRKTLGELVIDFFKSFEAAGARIFSYPKPYGEILHILDLIRTALIQEEHQYKIPWNTISHLQQQRIPTAVTLLKAGVKFEKGPAGCILDVKFKDGVFTIPVLTIDERTCPLFTNLLAYEQCYSGRSYKFTSYVVLMRNLIRTSKDVDLLCEEGIVVNWLLSAEDASKVFNEVCIDTTSNEHHYQILCSEVDKYHKSLWSRWMTVVNFICIYKLKRDYFDTPWATISVLAAFVILLLTILQTTYTMLPYYHHPAPPPG